MPSTLLVNVLLLAGLLAGCGPTANSQPPPADASSDAPDTASNQLPLLEAPDFSHWDPQFYRLSEISLSGPWSFAFDPDDNGMVRNLDTPAGAAEYELTITVPYPWQAMLSGVGPEAPTTYSRFGSEKELQSYAGTVWYSRTITPPPDWSANGEWVLRFGAADWSTTVYIDGKEVGQHVGGYDPFEVIVPEIARNASFFVAVQVDDPCAGDEVVGGKQGGLWYTCVGGIWQEVTLYQRPLAHITNLVETMADEGESLNVAVHLSESGAAGVVRAVYGCPQAECTSVTVEQVVDPQLVPPVVTLHVPLATFPRWSPTHAALLPRTLEFCTDLGCDSIFGYSARRTWSIDWVDDHSPADDVLPSAQYQGFFLNGVPFYVRGILDQGYHPEGISQYPSRASRIDELAALKALGFNTVRQHIKPEPPWFYAACDTLGLAVIYDLPCPYDVAPSPPAAPWSESWQAMAEALVRRDVNHPSILFWVNFNEAWGLLDPPFWKSSDGLEYVAKMAQWMRSLDPTRPVEDHSPGGFSEFLDGGALPHVDTDVNSFHIYDRSVTSFATRIDAHLATIFPGSTAHFYGTEPQAGQPLLVSEFGGLSADDTRGDSTYALHGHLNVLRSRPVIRGFVYTQAYDVEWERNGLWTYARETKETGLAALGMALTDLLAPNFLTLGDEPAVTLPLDTPMELTVAGMIVEGGPAQRLEWTLLGEDGQVVRIDVILVQEGDGEFSLPLPLAAISEPGTYRLLVTLHSDLGLLARNGAYIVVQPAEPPSHPLDETTLVPNGFETCSAGACWCEGPCQLTFLLPPPDPQDEELTLHLELSAYDPQEPQTDGALHGANVSVVVGETTVCAYDGLDAPADHRGVLSHLITPELRGAYGFLHTCTFPLSKSEQPAETVTIHSDMGLRVFTPQGGRSLAASNASGH